MKKPTSKLAVAACVAGMLGSTTGAYAATQSITTNIAFETAITLTSVNNIRFGFVTAGQNNTYTITAAGVITVTGAGTGVVLGGTTGAGRVNIVGSTTQTISITDGTYAAAAGGVALVASSATCTYTTTTNADCSALSGLTAPGAGTFLDLGVAVSADGTQAAGFAAAPTFVLTVSYT